jgi:hypothetical protein
VSGTSATEVEPWIRDSLYVVEACAYRRLRDGGYFYGGKRPGPDWHAHGTTARRLLCLSGGRVVRVMLRKQRWRHVETGATCHSRPPDELAGARACSLVVVLMLWSWLSSPLGLLRHGTVLPGLEGAVSLRTVQRWMRRALPLAREIQQACRAAVLQRDVELRPGESILPRGRGPPDATFRRWGRPGTASILFQALSIVLSGAMRLVIPVARLLAEAHGRWTAAQSRFPI